MGQGSFGIEQLSDRRGQAGAGGKEIETAGARKQRCGLGQHPTHQDKDAQRPGASISGRRWSRRARSYALLVWPAGIQPCEPGAGQSSRRQGLDARQGRLDKGPTQAADR